MNFGLSHIATSRKAVPRGLKRTGPAILSYGFRPFFLAAAIYALLAMAIWIGALVEGWEIGGSYGLVNWHAHEMLFGYATAALAGFMLTSIPNWTGRLPVSGSPLLGLLIVWLAGRIVMAYPDWLGLPLSMVVDSAFLPILATVAGIEIVAGKNWKNLKILAALVVLSVCNMGFHVSVVLDDSAPLFGRCAVGAYSMLIAIVGGRITPSFTRNWLVKRGSLTLPASFGQFDTAALAALLVALVAWVVAPDSAVTAILAASSAAAMAARLLRWKGYLALEEPLLLVLHVGYGFVALGMLMVAFAAMGWVAQVSALHVLTVGAIGNMTFAVMTRATLGHTGRPLAASLPTSLAYLAMVLAAVLRPFAEIVPQHYHLLLTAGGICWLLAFAIFVLEYGPMLARPRLASRAN